MKKLFFLVTALCLTLSACLPAPLQPQATSPAPNLEATAAIYSQQTLQALPTQTQVPSMTPVVMAPTDTPTQATPTGTDNPILLTLTATLGTGTVTAEEALGAPTVTITGALTTTPSITPNPAFSSTPAGTAHPQHYGTMPPNLPYGEITLINKSKADVYISLQCTTKDGYFTVIEYPVKSIVTTRAPAGKYVYVVWVGGRQIVGNFSLDKSQDLTINIYKDRVGIK